MSILELVEEWLAEREAREDCYCASGDAGTCWFHLTPEQQHADRVASLKKKLEGLL